MSRMLTNDEAVMMFDAIEKVQERPRPTPPAAEAAPPDPGRTARIREEMREEAIGWHRGWRDAALAKLSRRDAAAAGRFIAALQSVVWQDRMISERAGRPAAQAMAERFHEAAVGVELMVDHVDGVGGTPTAKRFGDACKRTWTEIREAQR